MNINSHILYFGIAATGRSIVDIAAMRQHKRYRPFLMKYFLIIVLFLSQFDLFSQDNGIYQITGHVIEKESKSSIEKCGITLISETGLILTSTTDSSGYYQLDSIPLDNKKIHLECDVNYFFRDKRNLNFFKSPHDTIVNFELSLIPTLVDWLMEIHFDYNSLTPNTNFNVFVTWAVDFLSSNPNLAFTIIGHKDSLETIDLRYDRAVFIYNALIKNGADKNRLTIETSDKHNILKPNAVYPDLKTKEKQITEITEDYIMNSPVEQRDSLRQLNRSVTLNIVIK